MYSAQINFSIPDKALDLLKSVSDLWHATKNVENKNKYRSDYAEIGHMLLNGFVEGNPYCDRKTFDEIEQKYRTLQDQAIVNSQEVPEHLVKIIKKMLPEALQAKNPEFILQIVTGGTHIQPHWDHNRRASSMFCLIEADGAETIWYEPKGEYTIPEKFRVVFDAELEQFNEVHRMRFEERKWYVFDHSTCHGAYRHYPEKHRTALVIEFVDLTAEQLYNSFVL
jgi:hypothetical protein